MSSADCVNLEPDQTSLNETLMNKLLRPTTGTSSAKSEVEAKVDTTGTRRQPLVLPPQATLETVRVVFHASANLEKFKFKAQPVPCLNML